jgi:uncharacterized phiE125 gp8 family phage protein
MRTVLVTEATFSPFRVEDIQNRPELRSTSTADLSYLEGYIKSAVEAYEEYTNSILCQSTWDLYLDEFPDGDIETPGPLISVTSIKYKDTANIEQTFSTDDYNYDVTNPLAGRIALESGEEWESTYGNINDVVIRFVAGYATANAIPQRIKDGLILKMQELYDGVQADSWGRASNITSYEACWSRYRRIPI